MAIKVISAPLSSLPASAALAIPGRRHNSKNGINIYFLIQTNPFLRNKKPHGITVASIAAPLPVVCNYNCFNILYWLSDFMNQSHTPTSYPSPPYIEKACVPKYTGLIAIHLYLFMYLIISRLKKIAREKIRLEIRNRKYEKGRQPVWVLSRWKLKNKGGCKPFQIHKAVL